MLYVKVKKTNERGTEGEDWALKASSTLEDFGNLSLLLNVQNFFFSSSSSFLSSTLHQLSNLDPLVIYNLKLPPYELKTIGDEIPISIRITLAAINLDNPIDDEKSPSTLRIIMTSLPVLRKADSDSHSNSDDGDKNRLDTYDGISSFVICTLNPKIQLQKNLELFINSREKVSFVVAGFLPYQSKW